MNETKEEGKVIHADPAYVLLITGDDYAATYFEQNFMLGDIIKDYGSKLNDFGVCEFALEYNDENLEAKLIKFDHIDPLFIQFLRNDFMDYDSAKHTNFYIWRPSLDVNTNGEGK